MILSPALAHISLYLTYVPVSFSQWARCSCKFSESSNDLTQPLPIPLPEPAVTQSNEGKGKQALLEDGAWVYSGGKTKGRETNKQGEVKGHQTWSQDN